MTSRIVMVSLIGTLLTGVVSDAAEPNKRPQLPALPVKTLDGETWSIGKQSGRVSVLHFWSLNCRPCLAVVPRLRCLNGSWKDRRDVALVSLPVDDNLIQVRRHVKQHRMAWTQLVTENGSAVSTLAGPLGVSQMPTPHYWIVEVDGSIAGSTSDLIKASQAAEQLALNAKAKKQTKD
ncbi:MAG: TlpA family protein disulfide reductase [Limisphaerales bacterium]